MSKSMDIFDELNLRIDPYHVLKIPKKSSDQTIKDAYKLGIKSALSTDQKNELDLAYNQIKNELKRSRYNFLRNRPFDNLDSIKEVGFKPLRLETSQWIDYLK